MNDCEGPLNEGAWDVPLHQTEWAGEKELREKDADENKGQVPQHLYAMVRSLTYSS